MHKKIHYIISGLIFFSFLFLFLASFSNNVLSTSDEDKYLCQKCNSSGNCTEYWDTKPCSINCSSCKQYSCKVCSNGSCSSKTFTTPCSNACANNDDCSGTKCNYCTGGQCKIKTVAAGTCIDTCTSDAQCIGGTTDTTEEKDKDDWICLEDGTCKEAHSGYSTKAVCEAACKPHGYYNICRKSNWSGLTGNQTLYCKKAAWEGVKPQDECQIDGDCGEGTTTSKYSCNTSTWQCSKDSNGTYTSLSTCQSACIEPTLRYSCNTSTWTCSTNSNGAYTSLSTCRNNCKASIKYSCNTSTWTCSTNSNGAYTSLSTCQANCVASPTKYSCNTSTWTCSMNSNGAYTSLANCQSDCVESPLPPSKCQIDKFSINEKTNNDQDPLLVWVNALLKGYISTNTSCIECTVTSNDYWGNPSQTYSMTLANGYKVEEDFKITKSGIYSFTLICYGSDPDDFDEDTASLQAVEALNLPWWREIIPVLPGFLRGIWE